MIQDFISKLNSIVQESGKSIPIFSAERDDLCFNISRVIIPVESVLPEDELLDVLKQELQAEIERDYEVVQFATATLIIFDGSFSSYRLILIKGKKYNSQ